MCKKIISFLLTLMMISGMISIPVMADDTSASTQAFGDEVVIADFTKIDDINNAEMDVDSEDKLFGDKSGKISQKKLDAKNVATGYFEIDSTKAPTNWSDYTYLNLWVHSEAVTEFKFAVMVRSSATVSQSSAWKHFNQDFAGWKKLSIPLSEISKGANFDLTNVVDTYVSFTYYTGNDIDALVQNFKKFSIARIWLSKEAEEEVVTDVTKEVYNSHSTSTTKAQLLDTKDYKYAVLSTEAVESNDKSLKLTGTGVVGCASRDWILHSDQSSEDWSSYNYLNFRIKNASTNDDGSAKNGGFGFRMFSKAGGYWWKSNLHSITNTEWHTFTVKIPDDLVHSKNSATSMNDICALKLLYISGTMYLEKIWLSTEDPNAPVVAPALESTSISADDVVSAYTRKIDFTYSKALDSDVAPTVTVAPKADYVVACENDTVQVIFPEALAAGTEYTVTISGVSDDDNSVSFSTEKYSAERSDTAVYARYAPSEDVTAKMFIAVYSPDDSLVKVEVIEDTDSNGVLAKDYVSLNSDESAKVFVWADDDTIKPLESPKEFLVDSEE